MRRALVLEPDAAAHHLQLGGILQGADRPRDASQAYATAARLAAQESQRGGAVRALFECALSDDGTQEPLALTDATRLADAWLPRPARDELLALAALRRGRHELARTLAEEAVARQPDSAPALSILGVIARTVDGDGARAAHYHERAFATGATDIHVYAAFHAYLLWTGDYARAGVLMARHHPFNRALHADRAERSASARITDRFADKTVRLTGTMGYGDTAQYARSAVWLRALGARVMLQVRPAIVDLMRTVDGVDRVHAPFDDEAGEDVDWRGNMIVAWLGLEPRLAHVGDPVAYLHPPYERRERWRRCLDGESRLRVGLVWAGTSAKTHLPAACRSMPFAALRPIWELPGVQCYSLQQDRAASERLHAGPGADAVIDLAPRLGQWMETAAAITALDIIVSVDTAIAHLAGALGHPVLLLLPKDADPRWMADRGDSPWYPSMRLLRQTHAGDWTAVVAAAVRALEPMAASRRSSVAEGPPSVPVRV